jgi:hypothetical protein
MELFKRTVGIVVIFSVLGLLWPKTTTAWRGQTYARAATTTGITRHSPESLRSPEEKIPVEEVAKKKRSKWWWVLGGALLVGAIAAAGGGGGGGSHGPSDTPPDDNPPPDDDTGDVTGSW